MKIILGVDGSAAATRAVEWCAAHAAALEGDVVVVYALDIPITAESGFGFAPIPAPPPRPTEAELDELRRTIAEKWCEPFAAAGVRPRVVIREGAPAPVIIEVATEENADLVITGRRGRGGFAELLLGSTSHHLSHHLDRPLVLVP